MKIRSSEIVVSAIRKEQYPAHLRKYSEISARRGAGKNFFGQ